MANMSYCRFQNTLRDLQDVAHFIDDEGIDVQEDDYISPAERNARQRLVVLCAKIVGDLIDQEGTEWDGLESGEDLQNAVKAVLESRRQERDERVAAVGGAK